MLSCKNKASLKSYDAWGDPFQDTAHRQSHSTLQEQYTIFRSCTNSLTKIRLRTKYRIADRTVGSLWLLVLLKKR